jgi:hypothetical protein
VNSNIEPGNQHFFAKHGRASYQARNYRVPLLRFLCQFKSETMNDLTNEKNRGADKWNDETPSITAKVLKTNETQIGVVLK